MHGWFLDGNGVSKIDVLVDGNNLGTAQLNLPRPDVQQVYPDYQNANSGYQYTLDTKSLSNGKHSIVIRETGGNGSTTDLPSQTVNVQHLPKVGNLDAPANGSTIKGPSDIHGWFLDENGVAKIEVLVDGNSVGTAQYGLARTDVQRFYSDYQNANSGYQYTLNTSNLTEGQHAITIRETGMDGSTTTLSNRTVNVQHLPKIGNLDVPLNGSTIKGQIDIHGWFLDEKGVAKIQVLVDGQAFGEAQYGISRPDVSRFYSDYQNTNSGYQYTLDTRKLSEGSHSLSIREIGNDGIITDLTSRTVNVQHLPVLGTIDAPASGATVNGQADIHGWLLDETGVAKIEVFVDGTSAGTAQYNLSRPDVQRFFPDYQNANSGYQFTLDTKRYSDGPHSITIRETGLNGGTKDLSSQIYVQNYPPKGFLDTPASGSTIKGNTDIHGWFLDGSGVSKIEILVDGTSIGQAQYNLSRPDVQQFFPDYQNANSGYQYSLDTTALKDGKHTITVRETGKFGKTSDLTITVYIQNLPVLGALDTPADGSTISGQTDVHGWVLDSTGVASVQVLVDGNIIGAAQYGISRPDVQQYYPNYQNSNPGYQYTLDTRNFADGQHTITVTETGANGVTLTFSKNVVINNGNQYLTLDLKKPSNITANDIVNFFIANNQSNSPLVQYAQAFIDAQNTYGLNAQYLVAHAIWETGWGGSDLKTYKHNLYGYGAYDVCPFTCGYYFPTGYDSISTVAYQVRHDYLDSAGSYYVANYGPTLMGMNVHYASDQNWKNGIASLMAEMKTFDYSYYSNVGELNTSAASPPFPGRDIPAGQPYPTNVVINYPAGVTGTVNTSSLTLRSLPYVSSSTVSGTLAQNTVVNVLGYNSDVLYDPSSTGNYAYRWYRVSVNGQNGWVYGKYLNITNLPS